MSTKRVTLPDGTQGLQWDMSPSSEKKDFITIPRADFEAYRAAAKALKRYHHPPSGIDAQDCPCCNCEGERAIAALRAAGILEEE